MYIQVVRGVLYVIERDNKMKVIKKINNNVALCIDNNDRELIAFGNGIGFKKIPYELNNMSEITRTFYGINENWI